MEPGNTRAPDGMEDCFVDRRLKDDMVVEGQEKRGEIMIYDLRNFQGHGSRSSL